MPGDVGDSAPGAKVHEPAVVTEGHQKLRHQIHDEEVLFHFESILE